MFRSLISGSGRFSEKGSEKDSEKGSERSRALARKRPEKMEGPKPTESVSPIPRRQGRSRNDALTSWSERAPVTNPWEPKQERQQQDLVPASSPYSLPQLTLQPESNVADSGQASQMGPDSGRLNSFESGLQQLQDTLDTPMSRWKREADPSQEIPHHYTPLSGPHSSIEETVLEDRSERKGNASQGASPITEPNFDEKTAFSDRPVDRQEQPETITKTAPAASTSTTKISSVVVQCLKDLGRFVSENLSSFASEVSPALWQDELGRLRVWAANIGAHQTGQSSLDHRLRDASHIKEQTLRVLQRLQRTIEDINDVLHHSPEDDDFSDLSENEDDDDHQTEIQSVYHALRDTINNLYQMSMVIRQPSQHDRLIGTKRSDAVFFEHFDRLHVTSKYPQAGENILKRLGLAISQRRAVMRYRERHRTKLGQGLSQVMEDQTDGQSAKLSETVATEFVETAPAEKGDLEFLTVASQTSYAQTILNGAEGTVLPSPPKESADGAPFECPYCFVIISITNRRAWARHVFNDLMPYLCIFPNCPTPHRLYESRRDWFSHLQSQHSISESPGIHVDCPLCLSSVPSGKQLERHVGRHLEELALFALPRSEEDDDEAPIYSDADSDGSHDSAAQGQCPQCGQVCVDLRAHAMTHNPERTEKCPIVSCDYHTRGFTRKYDMNRHVLAHYKGDMVCHFCPGYGTPTEKNFNRVYMFKRHLITVHGVMQMQPNQPGTRPNSSTKMGIDQTSGNCSICNETFGDAQDFYKHLDNCVMLKVMQEDPSEAINQMNLAGMIDDEAVKKTLKPGPLSVEDPVDQADYNDSHNDHNLSPTSSYSNLGSDREIRAATAVSLTYFGGGYLNDHGSGSETDTQSARENNLPGESNLEVQEPGIRYTPDYLEEPPSTQPMHWDRLWDADNYETETDERGPDIIVLRHRGATYPLRFRAYAIDDGIVTVGVLREEAARIVGAPFLDIKLLYKGKLLQDDNQTCKAATLKQHSEVLLVVAEIQPDSSSDSSHYEKGYTSDSLWDQPSVSKAEKKKKKKKKKTGHTSSPPDPPSRHPSPALSSSSLLSPPDLKTMRTAMEQLSSLTVYFERDIIPLCDEYIAQPPGDIKKRDYEHRKLSEMVLSQVMLPVDGIEPEGDVTVRNARRALVKQAQHVLNLLDAAAKV
ncbi:hypothetical protein PENFLA_c011G00274 [Penicillium flavigenum]|uniref:BAG domain-containing protein n=1 Tax=Penicillium flavigenum TaxID=254877 RepID=A0A1V6TAL3_9EURO|nr:hypothetical protein PENFLA_c011G00274 [Penicillium flavigenum]